MDNQKQVRGFPLQFAFAPYNGAARIGDVLDALAQQTLDRIEWEVLVVDNASNDGTGAAANRTIQEKLAGRARVVREEKPGLSFARARAAREASGDIICFLDDDNIPEPDFVKNAVQAFRDHPRAGALGGRVLPVWETTPSALALAVQDFALAICDRGNQAFEYDRNVGPVGAGLCLRAEVLRQIYRNEKIAGSVVGRRGGGFGGGEDLAIAMLVWQSGHTCWYEPSLIIRHLLPARRMEKDYLLRLYEGIGRGQAAVRRLCDWKARTPLAWLIGLKDLCRWQFGQWRGPSSKFSDQNQFVTGDLHVLHQKLIRGRACQALAWPR
jgi:glycosyltransferase involved in cell wall biosynthesis